MKQKKRVYNQFYSHLDAIFDDKFVHDSQKLVPSRPDLNCYVSHLSSLNKLLTPEIAQSRGFLNTFGENNTEQADDYLVFLNALRDSIKLISVTTNGKKNTLTNKVNK